MVTGSRRSTDRNCCSTGSPAIAWSYGAAGVVGHREKILRVEVRRVSRVSSGRDRMGDGSAATPIYPYVADTCAAALRGSCRNRVTRTTHP